MNPATDAAAQLLAFETRRREILALATAFMEAVAAGDTEGLCRAYAPDVEIWHSFDRAIQTREQNVRTLQWMHRHVQGLRYEDLRVAVLDDGFVQQHVLRADDPPLDVPCMLRAWCENGAIVRLEEYLDSAHTQALTHHIAAVRLRKAAR